MLFALLSIISAVTLLYFLKRRRDGMLFFKRLNIPGPEPSIFCGNLWQIYKNGHLVMQKRWHETYGPIVGYYFGPNPVLLVADVDLLKIILLKDFHDFADRSDVMSPPPGTGFDNALNLLKGQRWKDVRSTLTPSFTSRKLKQISPEVCATVDVFMKSIDECSIEGKECYVYELFQALTLDTICRVGMGVDFGVQNDVGNSKLLEQVKIAVSFPMELLAVILFSVMDIAVILFKITVWLRNFQANAGKDPVVILREQCSSVVKQRRNNPELRRNDLLQLMIDAQRKGSPTTLSALIAGDDAGEAQSDGGTSSASEKSACPFSNDAKALTDGEVIDNAFLVLLAGYETTSSALAFTTKLLLRFPEVQQKVREELLEATNQGIEFDFERLQGCQYTEAVIRESLRMYPPVYFFTSRASAADKEYGSLFIPKGTSIFVSVNELHFNPDIFEDPYEFKPERFLPENRTPSMTWAWQPFGAGPRNCIGMRFAQMEIKIALAKLLTKYKISSEREPLHDPDIPTKVLPNLQRIRDPLICQLEKI